MARVWKLRGTILGKSWAILWPSCAILRPPWVIMGPSWAILRPSSAILWGHLRPSWPILGPSWSHRRPSWGHYRPCELKCRRGNVKIRSVVRKCANNARKPTIWGGFGGPSWGHVVVSLGHGGALFQVAKIIASSTCFVTQVAKIIAL